MIGGIPLGFAQPLVLFGLLSLPVLWWLLRLVPPRPRRQKLGPEKLLLDILPKEETPARTPWWLTLLRLTLAALLIFAAAGPLWNPPLATSQASAPLALLIDDGWAAAATWDTRLRTAEDLIARAETDNRGVAIIPLSEVGRDISLETPGAARVRLRSLKPKPHTVDRNEALPAITRFVTATPTIEALWLSDGVDVAKGAEFVGELAKVLQGKAVTVVESGVAPAHALVAADNAAGALTVKVLRANPRDNDIGVVRALDPKGLPLGEAPFAFKGSERETEATFDLPVEIRNDIARLEIGGERSSGVVQLLDKRWRRRTVGVITGSTADTAQPLLASTYYLSRALNPFADVRLAERGSPSESVRTFLAQNLPMLILADVGNVTGEPRERLARWVDAGGVLVRFAGPRLAAADDDLIPVKLRRGGRTLGGSLSLGAAAAARGVRARKPVQRHDGAERRDGDAAGAGRARLRAHRPHLGDARRRHAAGDRGAARQGLHRAVPRHRRHALVGSADLGRVRRHAQAHRLARRQQPRLPRRSPTRRPRAMSCRRTACSTASARSPPRPRRRGRCRRTSTSAPQRITRPASMGHPKGCSP